jgi:hypothetical protein
MAGGQEAKTNDKCPALTPVKAALYGVPLRVRSELSGGKSLHPSAGLGEPKTVRMPRNLFERDPLWL